MEDLSYRTAISRKKLSAPMQFLQKQARLFDRMLDYGCGRGDDADKLGMKKYDPHYFPEFVGGGFEVVTCNYVLNVIENPHERGNVERRIIGKLVPGGDAYITVRNDKKLLNGKTSRGTWQGYVEPSKDWELIRENAKFRMYHYRKPLVLDPCPFCGSTNIRSGYMDSMVMGVECLNCLAAGSPWGYNRVIDRDGILLPEYQHLVGRGHGGHDDLDQWLLHRAQLDWNRRGE